MFLHVFFFFVVLGLEPSALCIPGKSSTTEAYLWLIANMFLLFYLFVCLRLGITMVALVSSKCRLGLLSALLPQPQSAWLAGPCHCLWLQTYLWSPSPSQLLKTSCMQHIRHGCFRMLSFQWSEMERPISSKSCIFTSPHHSQPGSWAPVFVSALAG